MSLTEIVQFIISNIYAVAIYLLVINFIGFALMGIDKHRAKTRQWRISEKTFFIVTILFGGIGSMLGMYTFRHKTKHWYFIFGIPAITIIEFVTAIALIFYFK